MNSPGFSDDPRQCLAEMIAGNVYAIVSQGATAEEINKAPPQMWMAYADLFIKVLEEHHLKLVRIQ